MIHTLSTQVTLLYFNSSIFATAAPGCPFRMLPIVDEETNAFDATLTSLVLDSECDACARILLPKQLDLEDGAVDLLAWFDSCIRQSRSTRLSDTGCVGITQPLQATYPLNCVCM
jgi:hypothetical protein